MKLFDKVTAIPAMQRYRYTLIVLASVCFLGPLAFLPQIIGSDDLCGPLCMRRLFLYFPGMTLEDFIVHASVAYVGVMGLIVILTSTFFFGRIWCSYICPAGGIAELGSRLLNDRWKIEFRALPQVQIRYGYFIVFLVALPALGVSACTLCNFITIPRLVEAVSGEYRGVAFIISSIGIANLGLLMLLGFFAHKGRAYCQFLCPIGALDGLVNRFGAKFRFSHHIRVERSRCSGCTQCAKQCMCGAIKMVDRVAVVDQLSCMSCHECVDVCEWNAIEWTTGSKQKTPKRIKKNVEIYPEPNWCSIHKPVNKLTSESQSGRSKVFSSLIAISLISIMGATAFMAYQ